MTDDISRAQVVPRDVDFGANLEQQQADLFAMIVEMHGGDIELACFYLLQKNMLLDYERPAELMRTEDGIRKVHMIVGQAMAGVYS